jgi:hypothetical protein
MARKKKSSATREAAAAQEQQLFDLLADVLRRAGHDVTVSKSLEGRGGDCLLRGASRIIVSRRLPLQERLDVLVDVARRADLAGVDVPAEVQALLDAGRPRRDVMKP